MLLFFYMSMETPEEGGGGIEDFDWKHLGMSEEEKIQSCLDELGEFNKNPEPRKDEIENMLIETSKWVIRYEKNPDPKVKDELMPAIAANQVNLADKYLNIFINLDDVSLYECQIMQGCLDMLNRNMNLLIATEKNQPEKLKIEILDKVDKAMLIISVNYPEVLGR